MFVVAGIGIGGAAWLLCGNGPDDDGQANAPLSDSRGSADFVGRTAARVSSPTSRRIAGIKFRHENAAHGRKLLPETMGGGCAFLDFDNDGDQDLLFVNGLRHWPGTLLTDDKQPRERWPSIRNDGTASFSDVTADSGLDVSIYGMGAAVGDYDNDGRLDVFITAVGENRLFHNEGEGKFRDVTDAAGVGGGDRIGAPAAAGSTTTTTATSICSCATTCIGRASTTQRRIFNSSAVGRAYGRPQNFEGSFPYLYRNDGDGTFTDVAEQAGVQVRNAATRKCPSPSRWASRSPTSTPIGWIDIVVANDTVQNFLFHNRGNGTFREVGAFIGHRIRHERQWPAARWASTRHASATTTRSAIAIGNFANEMTALYVSYGRATCSSWTRRSRQGSDPSSRLELKFGLFFWDYDLDGRLDLFTANGHLEDDINRVQPSQHYAQPPHLFLELRPASDTEFFAGDGATAATIC